MERGNTKHGPNVDDQMAHEVRGLLQGGPMDGRGEEWREPEPPGEDQPEATAIPAGERRGGAPAPLTAEEVEARSQLGRYIPLSALPGDRDSLLRAAQESEAPDAVLAELGRLPAGRDFETVSQVWAALGHTNEERRW
ncbi:MAG: DUF2795 domain-containing protein [Dactylosporangium sp.]|nr:DUF2795 domain-containing protein [Dactylosporangium sp.]